MTMRMFGSPFQHAYVTTDIDKAKQIFADKYGVTSYYDIDTHPLNVSTPRGPRTSNLKVSLAFVDAIQIELIQPMGGEGAKIYQDPLPASGFKVLFHHLAFSVPGPVERWHQFRAGVGNDAYPIAIEGDLGFVKFLYLDTKAELGHYCEYIWTEYDVNAPVPRN